MAEPTTPMNYKNYVKGKFLKLKRYLTQDKFSCWSQEEFCESLEEVNRLAAQLSHSNTQLIFCIFPNSCRRKKPSSSCSSEVGPSDEHGVDNNRWDKEWPTTLKIVVSKVNKTTNMIENEKVIDLNAYYKVLTTMTFLCGDRSDLEIKTSDVMSSDEQPLNDESSSTRSPSLPSNNIHPPQNSVEFVVVDPSRLMNKPKSSEDPNIQLPSTSSTMQSDMMSAEERLLRPSSVSGRLTASVYFDNISCLTDDSSSDESSANPFKHGISGEDAEFNGGGPPFSLCSICLDSKADMILSCLHAYCSECIENWDKTDNENHDKCPQCRVKMTLEDNWVLSNKPAPSDVNDYLVETIYDGL